MKKIQNFDNFLNELSGNVYKSVMNKVASKGDPRSFRLYSDAKKLRSKYYTKEPLNILVHSSIIKDVSIKFEILDIKYQEPILKLIGIESDLILDVTNKDFKYLDRSAAHNASIDRKGAIIIAKILKDYDIEVRPQDIPQS